MVYGGRLQGSRYLYKADWAEIILNSYRSRYLPGEVIDHRYDNLQERLRKIEELSIPTVMIQGGSDLWLD